MKKLLIVALVAVMASCNSKSPQTRFITAMDSGFILKAELSKINFDRVITNLDKQATVLYYSKDSAQRKHAMDTLGKVYLTVLQAFTDSTRNPIYKKQ